MLTLFSRAKNAILPKKQMPATPEEKRKESEALILEATAFGPDKKKKKKKRGKKAAERAKQQDTAKLERAIELEAAAQAQRKEEVSAAATDKMQHVQAQVDEVTGVMHDNMRKLLERGEKLEEVDARAQQLLDSSAGFKKGTKALKRDLQIKNLILGLILLGLVFGLVSGIYFCIFYGIFSKTAIPIIATTTGVGGAIGFLAALVIDQIYNLLKNTPLFNSGLKKPKKAAEAVLEKAGPKFEKKETLTSEQNDALQHLLAENKPPVSFATTSARTNPSSLPSEESTALSHNSHKSVRFP